MLVLMGVARPTMMVVTMIMAVRRRRIERMAHPGTPALTLTDPGGGSGCTVRSVHVRCGQKFLQLRLTARGAIEKRCFTLFLQGVKGMSAGPTLIIKDRHLLAPVFS
jgi:hypothetical protein